MSILSRVLTKKAPSSNKAKTPPASIARWGFGGSGVFGHDDGFGDELTLEPAIRHHLCDEEHAGTRGAILAFGRVELEGGPAEQGVLVEQVPDALV